MKLKDLFLFLLICLLVATESIIVKPVLDFVGPLFFSGFRALFGGSLLLLSQFFTFRPLDHRSRWLSHLPRLATMGFFFIFASSALVNIGLQLSNSVITANIVLQSSVIIGAFLGVIFLKEKISPRGLLGLAVSFIGILIATWPKNKDLIYSGSSDQLLLSVVFLTIGISGWSIYNILSKKLENVLPPGQIVAIPAILGGIMTTVLSLFLEGNQFSSSIQLIAQKPQLILPFLYSGPLVLALGTSIWHYLFKRYPLSKLILGTMLISIFTTLEATIFRNEHLNNQQLFGFLLVLFGFFLNKTKFGKFKIDPKTSQTQKPLGT